MNIRPDQLADVLNRQLHPVYLISGDEPLQVMESSDRVRAACRQQDYTEREVFDVDASFDWQLLKDEANSLSLFSSRRILDVRIPSAKPGREGGQALKEYTVNPPEDTVLLITSGKLEAAQKKSAWFKALDQAGVVMQCWPVGPDRLPAAGSAHVLHGRPERSARVDREGRRHRAGGRRRHPHGFPERLHPRRGDRL